MEHVADLGEAAREWTRGRGLDSARLEAAGWRSMTGRDARALAERCGCGLPVRCLPPGWRSRPLLLIPLWGAGGKPLSVRVRSLAGGGTLTLPGDAGRPGALGGLYGADAYGARAGDVLHVAEGEIDRESLIEAGALAVVGLPGAGARHGAVLDLARETGPRRVALWFDGDGPGREAAAKLAAKLAAAGIEVRRAGLPPGEDVNDRWRADPEGLARAVRIMETRK